MERCACCNKDCNPDEIVNAYCKECWGAGTVTVPVPVYEKMVFEFSRIATFDRYVRSMDGDIPRKMCEIMLGVPGEKEVR